MTEPTHSQPTVVRTERDLSIAGTRITIYDVMEYLNADWPPTLIQHWLNLSESQINDVLVYIRDHRAEVEAEYQHVVQHAKEIRTYWEEQNRDRFARIATLSPKPGQEELYAKIQAYKAELGMQ